MKKLFVGVVLPLVATAAIIGSGFSIWMFGSATDATATNSGNVQVEQIQGDSSTYEFTALKSLTLDFDQKTRAGAQNLLGVHWVYANGTDASIVTLTKKNAQAVNPTSITTTVTVPDTLLSYIVIGGFDGSPEPNNQAKTTTYTYNWADDEFNDGKATWDFQKVTVVYADGKEPTNADGVAALTNAVSGAQITVTYTAHFANN